MLVDGQAARPEGGGLLVDGQAARPEGGGLLVDGQAAGGADLHGGLLVDGQAAGGADLHGGLLVDGHAAGGADLHGGLLVDGHAAGGGAGDLTGGSIIGGQAAGGGAGDLAGGIKTGGAAIVTVPPTVVRTALTTKYLDNPPFPGLTTLTTASVTVATGELLVVSLGIAGGTDPTSVKFNGVSLTFDSKVANGHGGVYSLNVTSGATATIVVTWGSSFDWQGAALVASKVSGLTSNIVDKKVNASGSGTNPSSTATANTTNAADYVHGMVRTSGPGTDTPGTWSNSFVNGQRIGSTGGITTNITTSEGYFLASATGPFTAAKTGEVSHSWEAFCVCYK